MTWNLISLPIVAALIGWGTNVIAIKMLFWPREPIRIFGFEFLGVLPKRRLDIARSIADVLNDEILPLDELLDAANTPETRQRVAQLITEGLVTKVGRFLPSFIMDYAGNRLHHHVEELVAGELESLFPQLASQLSQELKSSKFLGSFVEDKIKSLDLVQLEELVLRVAKNELRHIELFGAVLGLVIGLIQVLLLVIF